MTSGFRNARPQHCSVLWLGFVTRGSEGLGTHRARRPAGATPGRPGGVVIGRVDVLGPRARGFRARATPFRRRRALRGSRRRRGCGGARSHRFQTGTDTGRPTIRVCRRALGRCRRSTERSGWRSRRASVRCSGSVRSRAGGVCSRVEWVAGRSGGCTAGEELLAYRYDRHDVPTSTAKNIINVPVRLGIRRTRGYAGERAVRTRNSRENGAASNGRRRRWRVSRRRRRSPRRPRFRYRRRRCAGSSGWSRRGTRPRRTRGRPRRTPAAARCPASRSSGTLTRPATA